MKIKRLAVTAYKNLVDAVVEPDGIHALTGCNGAGKTNFLETVPFLARLLTGSDEERIEILRIGNSPGRSTWFPLVPDRSMTTPLTIEMICIVETDAEWEVNYRISLPAPIFEDTRYDQKGQPYIQEETLYLKRIGKPGKPTLTLQRTANGETTVTPELEPRRKLEFSTKLDMSAIQTLEIRQASAFESEFPVLSSFRTQLARANIISIRSEPFGNSRNPAPGAWFSRGLWGTPSHSMPFFESLSAIKENPKEWAEFKHWIKLLCDIDGIHLRKFPTETAKETRRFVFFDKKDIFLDPYELSTGMATAVTLVTAFFTIRHTPSVILIEEPEVYLHPKAIIDLIKLFRSSTNAFTILFSTHSPVVLNSLNVAEVTLMDETETGFFTTRKVSSVPEAIAALNRGFVSFGDLLQTNFSTRE
jgi:ABC-type lipoprotein export system ATPase subunit